MTSAPITDVKSTLLGNIGNTTKGLEVQNAESFSKVFDKTQSPATTNKNESTLKKVEDVESIQNHANIQKNKTSENLKEQTEEVVDVEDMEKVAEETATMMVEKVAETFDMTVEEVEAVLEELGLTALDLLNSENLTKVVLALNPETDALGLMTNESLFADLKGLMNTAEELRGQLAEQFAMSEEELANFLQQMKEQIAAQVPEENVAAGEVPTLSEAVADRPMETAPVEMEVVEVMAEEVDADNVNVEAKSYDATVSRENTEGYDGTVIPKIENSAASRRETSDFGNNENQNAGTSFNQQFVNQLTDAIENATGSSSSYSVNGQEILRQITDYIRVHVNVETTEMELQLHPASLGNIKVQIASTEGVLTAVFTTENEAVKAALEGQLVQLKENFTQQGLKVESVEVNVSAQGFERSLDQQEQQGQNQFQNANGRNRSRRIRLNGIDGAEETLPEEMTEDDRIVADMMIRNGNSVDITV